MNHHLINIMVLLTIFVTVVLCRVLPAKPWGWLCAGVSVVIFLVLQTIEGWTSSATIAIVIAALIAVVMVVKGRKKDVSLRE